jgi:hypothetical protein
MKLLRFGVCAIALLVVAAWNQANATVEAGLFNTSGTTLEVRAKSSSPLSGLFTGMSVTVRWLTSYNITLGSVTNSVGSYGISTAGSTFTGGSYTYQSYACVPVGVTINFSAGVEYPLFTVPISGGTGTGTIEIVNDATTNANNGNWYFEFDGNDSTDYVTPFYNGQDNNVPLPVEISSFTALSQGRTINLSWATKTEINNSGFDVERQAVSTTASSASTWAKVGSVTGKGTTNTPQNYSYSDVVKTAGSYNYRLKQIDNNGNFTYSAEVAVKATLSANDYKLSQNYPNPFNPSTKFDFAVQSTQHVAIKVYNSIGQEVVTLFDGVVPADQIQEVTFDGSRLSSGLYFYVLRATDRVDVKKMMLLK